MLSVLKMNSGAGPEEAGSIFFCAAGANRIVSLPLFLMFGEKSVKSPVTIYNIGYGTGDFQNNRCEF